MAASKTLVLITGANQGIGLATARQLASSGKYHVLLGSRSPSKAHAAIQQLLADKQYPVDGAAVSPIVIDVPNDSSISETVFNNEGLKDLTRPITLVMLARA